MCETISSLCTRKRKRLRRLSCRRRRRVLGPTRAHIMPLTVVVVAAYRVCLWATRSANAVKIIRRVLLSRDRREIGNPKKKRRRIIRIMFCHCRPGVECSAVFANTNAPQTAHRHYPCLYYHCIECPAFKSPPTCTTRTARARRAVLQYPNVIRETISAFKRGFPRHANTRIIAMMSVCSYCNNTVQVLL